LSAAKPINLAQEMRGPVAALLTANCVKACRAKLRTLGTPRCRITMGFAFLNPSYVLALRAEIEQPGATLPPPDRYLDLSYYDRPLARVGK
jgi:hypothetical protein